MDECPLKDRCWVCSAGLGAPENTSEFLNRQIQKVKEVMEPLVELQELITVDIPLHRVNELRFYKEEIS